MKERNFVGNTLILDDLVGIEIEENLWIKKGDTKMKINYDVEIPSSRAEDVDKLIKFAESKHNTMCFEYDTEQEAKNRISVLKRSANKENLSVDITRMADKVYVERIGGNRA